MDILKLKAWNICFVSVKTIAKSIELTRLRFHEIRLIAIS